MKDKVSVMLSEPKHLLFVCKGEEILHYVQNDGMSNESK